MVKEWIHIDWSSARSVSNSDTIKFWCVNYLASGLLVDVLEGPPCPLTVGVKGGVSPGTPAPAAPYIILSNPSWIFITCRSFQIS